MATKKNSVATIQREFNRLFNRAKKSLSPDPIKGEPMNFVTGNVVCKDNKQTSRLAYVASIEGYDHNLWATANQIKKAGGTLLPEAYGVPCFMNASGTASRYYRVYNYDSVDWGGDTPDLKITPETDKVSPEPPLRGKHFRKPEPQPETPHTKPAPKTTAPETTAPKTNAEAPKAEACIPTNDEPIVVRLPEYGIYVSGRTNAQVRKALEAAVSAYKMLHDC